MIPLHVPPLQLRETTSFPKEDFISQLKNLLKDQFDKENVVFTADARNSLYLALKMMHLDKKDTILMPAYICDAVSVVIKSVCTPVYIDINSRTFNIDPALLEKNITPHTKGILITHLYGNSCDIDKIVEIAKRHNLQIIEDCAQAIGGTFQNKTLGSFGDFTILSFRFSKDVTSLRGGALLTNNKPEYDGHALPLIKVFPEMFFTITAFGLIRSMPAFIYAPTRSHLLVPLFHPQCQSI